MAPESEDRASSLKHFLELIFAGSVWDVPNEDRPGQRQELHCSKVLLTCLFALLAASSWTDGAWTCS